MRFAVVGLSVSLLVSWGCDRSADGGPDLDAGPDAAGYPAPRTDLVPPVGSDATLDIATWNIENFPRNPSTPAVVADLIASLDLDVVAVQEIEDIASFEEVVDRLPEHEGVLSTHTYSNGSYQKIGFIYRSDLVTLGEPELLFPTMGYEFPRPPLQVRAVVARDGAEPFDLILVTLHLKAGRDVEDRERRTDAMIALAAHLETAAASIDPDIIALGDFNEVVTSSTGLAVFDPFLADPATYTLLTADLAAEGKFSFVPSRSILDHVLASEGLADELLTATDVIPPLHTQLLNYEDAISDHLPVVVSLPL